MSRSKCEWKIGTKTYELLLQFTFCGKYVSFQIGSHPELVMLDKEYAEFYEDVEDEDTDDEESYEMLLKGDVSTEEPTKEKTGQDDEITQKDMNGDESQNEKTENIL